jgi:hypothetical protein
MRHLHPAVWLALLFAFGLAVLAGGTASALSPGVDSAHEVLVLNATDTELVFTMTYRRGALIQNGGPNSIFCAIGPQSDAGSGAVLTKSLEVAAGATLWMPGMPRMFCRAATADQVTGGATRIQEVP